MLLIRSNYARKLCKTSCPKALAIILVGQIEEETAIYKKSF